MVKNLPTIERSTKIRFGKHANDDQAENTIVFNASDSSINATQSGSMYMTPLRTAEISGSTFLGYVPGTKEVVNTGVLTSLLGGVTLESAANQGNTISNVVQYTNETTSFITSSNVGISNTAPTHALSIKDKVFISGPIGDPDDLRVEGNTKTNKLQTGTEVTIDKNATNKIQVSGIVKTDKLHADFIGVSNIAPTNLISIGPDGQTTLNIPSDTAYALSTTGNVNAQNYRGDGGLLSNISLQTVSDKSNITSNTIILSNSDVGAKALGSIVAESAFYGQIKGSNAIAASTVTATSFSGNGANITAIDPTNINGAIGVGAGGTGLTSFSEGDIIYANSTSSLAAVGTGSATAGQFLKLNSTKTAPEWSDVPLTLDEVLASQTGVSNVSDEVITLSKGSGVAMEIETAQLALNGSGTVLNAPNGNITAGSFAGDGSAITHLDLGDATNTGQVAVARGGTGATTTTGGGTNAKNVLSINPTFTGTVTGTFSGSGASLTNLPVDQFGSSTIGVGNGGTGQSSFTAKSILIGAGGSTALSTVAPLSGTNEEKYLRFSTDGSGNQSIGWETVSSGGGVNATQETNDDSCNIAFVKDGAGSTSVHMDNKLKYDSQKGSLYTSNIVTSDTTSTGLNGISNTTSTHTLSVGTVVSIQETPSGDVLIVRGNGYFNDDVYIAKKLTMPSGSTLTADTIKVRSMSVKETMVVAERPVSTISQA